MSNNQTNTHNDGALTINIMMLGGKRCGKTSVLAAMNENFKNIFAKTQLKLLTDDYKTADVLHDKLEEIKDFLKSERPFDPLDDNPTPGKSTYRFNVSLNNKDRSRLNLNFVDSAGEYLTTDVDQLQGIMENSNIILIAIDSPYLMEENGEYNDKRNHVHEVTDRIERFFNLENKGPVMVLFVPLKCELYRRRGEMNKLRDKICSEYGRLIDTLTSEPNKDKVTVAITPILTTGAVEFARFKLDENGDYAMTKNEKGKEYPISIYRKTKNAELKPRYCEQPFIYVMLYTLKCAQLVRSRNNGFIMNLVNAFGEYFLNWASADDFMAERGCLRQYLKKSGDGYLLINDPLKFT